MRNRVLKGKLALGASDAGQHRIWLLATHSLELAVVAFIYFCLVKIGLTLASLNPSASPVWP
jgi:hypothetical protein